MSNVADIDRARARGRELLARKEQEDRAKKAAAVLLRRAKEARSDPVKFLEFVMREEKTQTRIKAAAHQKLMVKFALAPEHDRSVSMIPADHAKTFSTTGIGLYLLQQDTTMRGAIISATQEQAAKPLKVIRDYIESSAELKLVCPHLAPSQKEGDPWTQTMITVDRPPGIKDPSLQAVGINGAITGSRLDWIVVDDILNPENTGTQDQRKKVHNWFDMAVLSRLVRTGGRIVVCNTAYHPEDLLHVLKTAGWPTLKMDILGGVYIFNTDFGCEGEIGAEDLCDASDGVGCRLVANEDEPPERQTLWPDRYDMEGVERLREGRLPQVFNQLYMNEPRDDETSLCKIEYIDKCKAKAHEMGIYDLVSKYDSGGWTFTGVDLAVSPGEEHDFCAFFTFEVRPNKVRVLLDVEFGQFAGPVIVQKIIKKHQQYNSIVTVENNAAQDFIRQFALAEDISLPIKPYTTGRTKAHPEHGVPGLFVELSNGAWAIPNDRKGRCHPAVQKWIDECLYYAPSKHTGDILMASFFAREQAKKFGALGKADGTGPGQQGGSLGMRIMSR